jgi:hypothetical protein
MSKEEIINKSENEWKNELTPEQYQICRMKGQNLPLLENTGILKIMEFINVFVVVIIYFHRRLNLILVQVGQVFLLQSTKKM